MTHMPTFRTCADFPKPVTRSSGGNAKRFLLDADAVVRWLGNRASSRATAVDQVFAGVE